MCSLVADRCVLRAVAVACRCLVFVFWLLACCPFCGALFVAEVWRCCVLVVVCSWCLCWLLLLYLVVLCL